MESYSMCPPSRWRQSRTRRSKSAMALMQSLLVGDFANSLLQFSDVLWSVLPVNDLFNVSPKPKVAHRQVRAARWPSCWAIATDPALSKVVVEPRTCRSIPMRWRPILLPDELVLVEFWHFEERRKDVIVEHVQVTLACYCVVEKKMAQGILLPTHQPKR